MSELELYTKTIKHFETAAKELLEEEDDTVIEVRRYVQALPVSLYDKAISLTVSKSNEYARMLCRFVFASIEVIPYCGQIEDIAHYKKWLLDNADSKPEKVVINKRRYYVGTACGLKSA